MNRVLIIEVNLRSPILEVSRAEAETMVMAARIAAGWVTEEELHEEEETDEESEESAEQPADEEVSAAQ